MRRLAKSLSFRLFHLGQALGLSVAPTHYYVPLADARRLRRTRESWARPSAMAGIETSIDGQLETLRAMVAPHREDYAANTAYREGVAGRFGPGYGEIEAMALHGMIRSIAPKTVIEVGSGVSTHCMLAAMAGRPARMVCISPTLAPFLREAGVELVEAPVEAVDPAVFDQLEAGDVLFIDSSHAVRPGGDVIHLYLEVVPRLAPGVHVHVHDVFLPYHYNRDVLHHYMQWTETALLQALLVGNARLRLGFSLSMLHYERPEALAGIFPGYVPQPAEDGLTADPPPPGHFPSAAWLVTA